ncbi:MarR family winged helix-turn-helix transcriptional regulator [Undibacterium terreum]|uniref:MarR family transcriptional regulator n=1 Tax=Undibacterium terreum TaxID=1224302 RepID=A0A916UKC2_9BURK|nr:MarR family transcriptional regulator [Undibacterium terreum]GGC75824.1 MarR family transcriptional regulator [Undibacterium terreum]
MPSSRSSPIPASTLAIADELRTALYRLHRQLRRESADETLGVSPLQNLFLAMINDHPGIGVGELARMEKLRGPTISGHIKSLEAAGLVTRAEPDKEDRRRVGLLVTEKGRETLDALRMRRRDWLARQLAALSPDSLAALRDAIGPMNEISS